MPSFLDLFCGAGGFSLGMRRAGWTPAAGVDSDPDSVESYVANFGGSGARGVVMTIGSAGARERLVRDFGGSVDAVVGGPPCQSFSKANGAKKEDPRSALPVEFARAAVALGPRVVLMEEVPQLLSHDEGRTAGAVVRVLEGAGYAVSQSVVDAQDYGVPQRRRRAVLAAFRHPPGGLPFSPPAFPPAPTHAGRPVPAGRAISRPIAPASPCDPAPRLPHRGPRSNPPGHDCRRRLTGPTLEKVLQREKLGRRFNDDSNFFPGAYALLDLSAPSGTVTTQLKPGGGAYTLKAPRGGGYFAVSMRDAQRLQGFPAAHLFRGGAESRRRQIGNSVPPPLAAALGRWAAAALA